MGAVKDTATKVIKTVAKTTKNVVQGAVALARSVRGEDERDRQAGRPSRESSGRGRSAGRRGKRERETPEPTTGREAEQETQEQEQEQEEAAESEADLDEIWGIGEARADKLREMGLKTVGDVAEASADQLKQMSGVGDSTVEKIKESARELSG